MLPYAATVLAARTQASGAKARATFGRLEVAPNATNAVPSRITAWLDARAASTPGLEAMLAAVAADAVAHAEQHGTTVTVTPESVSPEVAFDTELTRRISHGHDWPVIPTGAGHDAGVLATAGIPAAMLFVRNPTGVSHSPDEHAEMADCVAGAEALADTLERLTS
jgi:N-carbamoyl-L-amino-acid hydrolase